MNVSGSGSGTVSLKRKVPRVETSSYKRQQTITNFDICIVCQNTKKEKLTVNPQNRDKLLAAIKQRSIYGDGKYSDIYYRLERDDVESQDKITWHRRCYNIAVNTKNIQGLKQTYEKRTLTEISENDELNKSFTRSLTTPYTKSTCFFCCKPSTRKYPLHSVSTENAGRNLRNAIENGTNDELKVRLCKAIDPSDALSIDVVYHNKCWCEHVTNSKRKLHNFKNTENGVSYAVAEVEFLTQTKHSLDNGDILLLSDLEKSFVEIQESYKVQQPITDRRTIKALITQKLCDAHFVPSSKSNQSERLVSKTTTCLAISNAQDENDKVSKALKTALFLRNIILSSKQWVFTGSLNGSITTENIPNELSAYFKCVITGKSDNVPSQSRQAYIEEKALSLSQNVMYACLTSKQVLCKSETVNATVRKSREFPQPLGLGIAIHQAFRSKKLIDMLHGFSLSVDYKRILRLENQIANTVIKRMIANNGMYIPHDFISGRHVFFAIDNCDFSEDTADGKRTLHGTAMAIYQQVEQTDVHEPLPIDVSDDGKSMLPLPGFLTDLLPCNITKALKPKTQGSGFQPQNAGTMQTDDLAWLMAGAILRRSISNCISETDKIEEKVAKPISTLPTWAAYNSLITKALPITRIASPPLLAAPAHEWQTLLTVLKQAQGINTAVVGERRKTVITLDMGLYQPAMKLLLTHDACRDQFVIRPGELHTVMAMCRTIGSYIENSGIDAAWIESGMYGPVTCKHVLDAKHIRRSLDAHITTLVVLFDLYFSQFVDRNGSEPDLLNMSHDIQKLTCNLEYNEDIRQAHDTFIRTMEQETLSGKLLDFDRKMCTERPMFKVVKHYMEMVLLLLQFIRAYHTGDWQLHLSSLDSFTKFFFAMDKLVYARHIPLYLAEMKKLKEQENDIWKEFERGNWVVNKNHVPFCAIGPDHALEHINKIMKVSGGLVGITLNENARSRFFLISPHLSALAKETRDMSGRKKEGVASHHDLNLPRMHKQERDVAALKEIIQSHSDPFKIEENAAVNIMTRAIMPKDVTDDITNVYDIGQKAYCGFVEERLNTENGISIWGPIKKLKLSTWKQSAKKTSIINGDRVVELREDRSLFARMLIVARSRPEIPLQETLGTYELSVVPRSLFSMDGSMIHASCKSQLMKLLESVVETSKHISESSHRGIAVVDGMVELQSLFKPPSVKTCEDLAGNFLRSLSKKYFYGFDETHVIFDRYDIDASLKQATRTKRLGKGTEISYHITDNTQIGNITMKQLLSANDTKDELTAYLSTKLIEFGMQMKLQIVVAWRDSCVSSFGDFAYLASSQEEADTKLILHSVDAQERINGVRTCIFSQDTDVLVLAVHRAPELSEHTYFCTGNKEHRREISVIDIHQSLGALKASALPALHAISGADNTGGFAGKGKLSFWKAYQRADQDTLQVLANMGSSVTLFEEQLLVLEAFVCKIYMPNTKITTVSNVRWHLFRTKQSESEKLPPTRAALIEVFKRAHYQCVVWCSNNQPNPTLPDPSSHGWKFDNGYKPIMTTLMPAPLALIELVRCACSKTKCCTNRCNCRANNLVCTELCECGADEQDCTNFLPDTYHSDDDIDDPLV